jgi:hypothetical protein
MGSIRQESEKKANRNRECWVCAKTIKKGEQYWNREFRYDKTIITLGFHLACYGKPNN